MYSTTTDLLLRETPVRFSQGLVDSLQSSPEVKSDPLIEDYKT
jgi:hypothetical protein